MTSLKEKRIKVTIMLMGEGKKFDDDGNNTLVFDGLRTECRINFGNGAPMPSAQIRLYGLRLENMLTLFRVEWNTKDALQNVIQIEAGDNEKMSLVYKGNITFAKPDFASAPDVCLNIESHTAFFNKIVSAPPRSFEGEFDVAQAISQLCDDMGMAFENNGVTAKLSNQYLADSAMNQVQILAQNADLDLYIDNDVIAITPKGVPRMVDVPVIKPTTGLIGYPIPDRIGVQFSCLYDPALRFGGLVEIADSIIPSCNGKWRVFGMTITLESFTSGGKWEAFIQTANAESETVHVAK